MLLGCKRGSLRKEINLGEMAGREKKIVTIRGDGKNRFAP